MLSKTIKANAAKKYNQHAESAVRAEKNGEWKMAALLWAKAEEATFDIFHKRWAHLRNAFCINAAERGWVAPHAAR